MYKPIKYGAAWGSGAGVAANVPVAAFLPGDNVRGAIVHLAAMSLQVASSFGASIVAKGSAPAGVMDGDVVAVGDMVMNNGSLVSVLASVRNIYIPPGKGLYFIASAATGVLSERTVLYDLL